MAPTTRDVRNRLIANLQTHNGMTADAVDKFKDFVTACDYISRDDHCGGVIIPGTKHYRRDGTEHTFSHVPLSRILEDVETRIENYTVPRARRTEVFQKVMAGIPGRKKNPRWERERPVVNPNEKPRTPFSISRARDNEFAQRIAIQITWWDAMGDDKRSPSMSFNEGVRGGRLGRDHTLDDVPSHYVRDCLMDYINDQLPASRRQAARKAVFTDLMPAEVNEYSIMIQKLKEHNEIAARCHPPPERNDGDQKERLEEISRAATIRSLHEASNIWQQEKKFEAIDESIDLAPRPVCGTRSYSDLGPIAKSVVKPSSKQLEMEQGLDQKMYSETIIDRDCDQIRAMIKIFTHGGEWTPDTFRLALGGITRPTLTTFLDKKGPTQGAAGQTFHKSWEFFKRREILGLPLTLAPSNNALQELDPNRGKKRKSAGNDAPPAKKTCKIYRPKG